MAVEENVEFELAALAGQVALNTFRFSSLRFSEARFSLRGQ